MTISLKDALREMLRGWQDDLSSSWQHVLAGVEPGFDAVGDDLELHPWEPIFPTRPDFSLPGAPPGAHLFHAFDGLEPDQVRCLVLGQDPYPSVDFATGRAFEVGGYSSWAELEKMASCSMRCLIQCIYASRSCRPELCETINGWPEVLEAIRADASFPAPSQMVQPWVDQGVLLLNASLTLSRFSVQGDPHQVRGHLPLWRPIMARLIDYFAQEAEQDVVFMLFGDAAREAADVAGLGVDGHPAVITMPHPAAGNDFLRPPNPFDRCNEKLLAMQADPIRW